MEAVHKEEGGGTPFVMGYRNRKPHALLGGLHEIFFDTSPKWASLERLRLLPCCPLSKLCNHSSQLRGCWSTCVLQGPGFIVLTERLLPF